MALASINDVLDLGSVTCGLMYIGESFRYPEHEHEPQELYLVLTGNASWRYGGNDDYRALAAGSIVYNPPWVRHGVIAKENPLVALYVLWPESADSCE